jgi:hypothetical protein
MTLKAFQEMAALITRAEVKRVTGLSDGDISALVAAGRLNVFRRPEGGILQKDAKGDGKGGGPRGGLSHGHGPYHVVRASPSQCAG